MVVGYGSKKVLHDKTNKPTYLFHMISFWGYGFLIFPAYYSVKTMFGKFLDIFSDSY